MQIWAQHPFFWLLMAVRSSPRGQKLILCKSPAVMTVESGRI